MGRWVVRGICFFVVVGLVVTINGAPSTLSVQGTVPAIHRVVFNTTGATTPVLGPSVGKVGEVVINNNNPTGFAVRFYSQNYANGFKNGANAAAYAVLKLDSSSAGYPGDAVVSSANIRNATYPGVYAPYTLTVCEKSAQPGTFQRGILLSNIAMAGTTLTQLLSTSPTIQLKNAVNQTNEVRFLSPTQASVDHTLEIGIIANTSATLYSGTYKDVIEVAILDFDTSGADTSTLYDGSGSATTF